jgi:hypothetical protein
MWKAVLGLICGIAYCLFLCHNEARAQEEAKAFKIEFKVFPANSPTAAPLLPFDTATIHYRNKVEGQPDFKFNLPVAGPDDKGFYSIPVQEGWLIDNLVIRVKGAVNPAVVTKLVTRQNMVIYPGASDSGEEFKFPAYMTQMGTYRSLYREFIEDAPAEIREVNRASLLAAFRTQLENMAKVNDRLPKAKPEELAAASKLKDEVIRLYFALPDAQVQVPPIITISPPPIVYYYPNYCPNYWESSCRFRVSRRCR